MLSAALPLLPLLWRVASAGPLPPVKTPIPFIDDTSLGELYPFNVHMPAGDSPISNPPLHIFLHGMGSRGDAGEMDTLTTWNGVGRRIDEYYAGNRSDAPVLAAEQFMTVMPLAPNNTDTDWNLDGVMAVVTKVQFEYAGKFDPTRVYVSGYSMGARAVWWLLLQNTTSFSAGMAAAGEPLAPFPDFTPMLTTPMRHYLGSEDDDGSSTVAEGNATQAAVEATAGYAGKLEMVIVPGPYPLPAHNSMADDPFDVDYLNWLLQQKGIPSAGNVAASNSTTSSSSSSSAGSSPTGSSTPGTSSASSALPRAATALVALAAWTLLV